MYWDNDPREEAGGYARTVLKIRARRELCAYRGFRGSGMVTDLEAAGTV